MPFMIGIAPIRRTLKYLEAGKIVLKNSIQILSLNYNTHGDNHQGIRDFAFWHIPQLQYKNPNVQIVQFRNITPTPFITCYYENGRSMLIDVDGKSRDEIINHLVEVIGKSKHVLAKEMIAQEEKESPANFGTGCLRGCICTIMGQVPCPGVVCLPNHMRGKWRSSQES